MKPDLMLDTNVALEALSGGDLWAVLDKDQDLTDQVQQRLFRLQCVFALQFHLHRARAWTTTAFSEVIATALKSERFAPDVEGKPTIQKLGAAEISLYVHKLGDALPGWRFASDDSAPKDRTGGDLDDWYVARAREHGVPLISNEGWTTAGLVESKSRGIRRKAAAQGVAVFTTKEFLLWRGVPIRHHANLYVSHILRVLARKRVFLSDARVYDLRKIASFRCACSKPRRYGVFCCPELGISPLPRRYHQLVRRLGLER